LIKPKSQPTKPKPTKPKPQSAKSQSVKNQPAKAGGGGKPASKATSTKQSLPKKLIADNRKTRQHYEIIDSIECGMILLGSEVKSLRNGKCQLDEAYGRVKGETLWLVGCNIAEYPQATVWNHEPKRVRQLLVHRREMLKFIGKAKEKGLTLIPLKMYFNERGVAKCEMALCKGLKLHDKRDKLKKADAQRDMQRAMRRR
jgi:SsrA-binding protein